MRIALDTNAYSAFKRGDAAVLEVLQTADEIGVSVVVLGELAAGFAVGGQAERNRHELERFLDSRRVQVLAIDADTVGYYAAIYTRLRRKGCPIPTNDLWIAAVAMQHGQRLLTLDRHFEAVDGLLTGQALDDFLP
jgi:predicted nucleic acid-binding protein